MTDAAIMTHQEDALVRALLSALRADTELRAAFGDPVRLYDAETTAPAFPYVQLERHESRAADTVVTRRLEHTIHFATYTRHGGLASAKAFLGVFRGAVERLVLTSPGQRIVLVMPTYCDVLRTRNQKTLRGVLHVRVISEVMS